MNQHEDQSRFADTERINEKMKNFLSLLYCRSIFQDFRRPVESLYPSLAKEYLSVITKPKDLGTILDKAYKKELTLPEFRQDLILVYKNALSFNEENSVFQLIAKHFKMTSEALFEEMFEEPLEITSVDPFSTEYKHRWINIRRKRLQLVISEPLSGAELRFARKNLSIAIKMLEPQLEDLSARTHQVLDLIQSYLDEYHFEDNLDLETLSDFPPAPSLRDILSPLLPQSSTSLSSLSPVLESSIFTPTFESLHGLLSASTSFITQLDRMVGVLSILLNERRLRGSAFSAIWANPNDHLVWAQPSKESGKSNSKSIYWPGMVIVSSSPLFHMPKEVMAANLERMPEEILGQLLKLKPRASSGSSHDKSKTPKVASPTITSLGADPSQGSGDGSVDVLSSQSATKSSIDSMQMLSGDFKQTVSGQGASTMVSSSNSSMEVDTNSLLDKNQEPLMDTTSHPCIEPYHEAPDASEPSSRSKSSQLSKSSEAEKVYLGAKKVVCPPGYLIVEFFRSHDFGWIKADAAIPMQADGSIPKQITPSKLCNKNIISEAEEARQWILRNRLQRNEIYPEEVDLLELPSPEDIEASIQLPFNRTMILHEIEEDKITLAQAPPKQSHSSSVRELSAMNGTPSASVASKDPKSQSKAKESKAKSTSSSGLFDSSIEWSKGKAGRAFLPIHAFSESLFNSCIVDGKFLLSHCPLPTPNEPSSSVGDTAASNKSKRNSRTTQRANFRRNAIARMMGVAHWMELLKPLGLQAFAKPEWKPSGTAEVSSSSYSPMPNSTSHTSHNILSSTDEIATNKTKTLLRCYGHVLEPEKQPYQFSLDLSEYSTQVNPSVAEASLNTISLEVGCSRFLAGEGPVYSRIVDFDAPIFRLESQNKKLREAVLRKELVLIDYSVHKLNEISKFRADPAHSDHAGAKTATKKKRPASEMKDPTGDSGDSTSIAKKKAKKVDRLVSQSGSIINTDGLPGKVGLASKALAREL